MPEVVEQEQELKTQALTIVERAKLVKITDQASYDQASSLLLNQIVPFRKRWAEYWSPLKESAWKAYKAVTNKISEIDDPAEQAERSVKGAIRTWDEAQEKIRHEAQLKAQQEAERQAEEERLRAAIVAEEAGASDDEVKAIVDTPVAVVAAPVEPTYQRASGISTRKTYKCKVIDLKALARAVVAGKVPVDYILPNQKALDARAKADGTTLNIPGCVSYEDVVIAARTR